MRQLDTLPSRLTRMVTPTTPLGIPVDDSRLYSESGIFVIRCAGVKRE